MPRPVKSFEYKMMLQKERFAVPAQDLPTIATEFKSDLATVVKDVVELSENPFVVDKQQIVTFYDTPDRYLRSRSYVFRERHKVDKSTHKMTLKFRHSDRCLAQDRDMTGIDLDSGKTEVTEDLKFEEDLKPVLRKLYSHSNKVKIKDDQIKDIKTLGNVSAFFPDIGKQLDDWEPGREIGPVSDFTAHEVVLDGPKLQLPFDIKASCALVIWYCEGQTDRNAIVSELSFNFDNNPAGPGGGYDNLTTDKAAEVYLTIQAGLVKAGWADADLGEAVTKTRFVYERAKGICDGA